LSGVTAKQLAQFFFVVRYAVLFDQFDKVSGSIGCQSRLAKVRIFADISLGLRILIGKVATATAGDQDLASNTIVMIEHEYVRTIASSLSGAHEASTTGADNDGVIVVESRHLPNNSRLHMISAMHQNKRKSKSHTDDLGTLTGAIIQSAQSSLDTFVISFHDGRGLILEARLPDIDATISSADKLPHLSEAVCSVDWSWIYGSKIVKVECVHSVHVEAMAVRLILDPVGPININVASWQGKPFLSFMPYKDPRSKT